MLCFVLIYIYHVVLPNAWTFPQKKPSVGRTVSCWCLIIESMVFLWSFPWRNGLIEWIFIYLWIHMDPYGSEYIPNGFYLLNKLRGRNIILLTSSTAFSSTTRPPGRQRMPGDGHAGQQPGEPHGSQWLGCVFHGDFQWESPGNMGITGKSWLVFIFTQVVFMGKSSVFHGFLHHL